MSLSSSFCLLLTIEMINLAFCIRTLFNSLTSRRHFLNCAFAIKESCGILRARLWIRIAVHFLFTVTAPTRKLTEHHFPQPFGCLWKWNYIKLLITQHFFELAASQASLWSPRFQLGTDCSHSCVWEALHQLEFFVLLLMICFWHLSCALVQCINSWRQMTECLSIWQVIHNWIPCPRWPSFTSQSELPVCCCRISPLN